VRHGTDDDVDARNTVRRVTITVEEAAEMLGISRTSAYLCAARHEIPTLRLGRRVLVPVARFMAMLEDQPPNLDASTDDDSDAA
jgi:excisionase family DNA binding protein